MKIGKGFTLPADAAEDVIAIVGRRGRGKTNTAVVMVEELQREGARFCVADPVGVWYGLKSSRDGKSPGIPVVVMGGEHQDVPLEETAGRVIADFVADKSAPSVVLDFRGFRKAQMGRFMADFLEQLYQRNRDPLHLVLDEADQFAPQRVMGETARLVGAAEDVCKMGRARGLLPILITQRPAALNKNVLTQAGLLIAHQLTGPQDQKAVDEWIRANAEEEKRAEFMATIATLERGEAWFWQPEVPIFRRVQVRERETFDSSSTPKRGARRAEPKAVAAVDLAALSEQIKATIERAKAEDPRELRKRIADLERQLKARLPAAAPAAPAKVEKVACPVKAEHVKRVEAAARKIAAEVARASERLAPVFESLRKDTEKALTDLTYALVAANGAGANRDNQREGRAAVESSPAPAIPRPRAAAVRPHIETTGQAGIGGGLRRMMIALAQRPGLNRKQLGVRSRLSSKSGTFDTYLSRGRGQGWIHGGPDSLALTPAGVAALGSYEPLPEGRALLEHWLRELKGGAVRMLANLAEVYPRSLTRAELGAAADISAVSGTFDTYLSRLRTLELVTGKAELRASEEFFE